jgi:hypothetical protein
MPKSGRLPGWPVRTTSGRCWTSRWPAPPRRTWGPAVSPPARAVHGAARGVLALGRRRVPGPARDAATRGWRPPDRGATRTNEAGPPHRPRGPTPHPRNRTSRSERACGSAATAASRTPTTSASTLAPTTPLRRWPLRLSVLTGHGRARRDPERYPAVGLPQHSYLITDVASTRCRQWEGPNMS